MTVTDAHGLEEAGQHGGGGTGLPDPMHQFEIKRLVELDVFGVDASFTNSGLFMVIAAVLITLFTLIAMRRRALVPGRLQSVAEVSYEFVANMVRDNVGTDGMKYFPFIFTLFMFVLALNMLGMVPYSFTVTSHIIVTFGLAAFIFIGVTLIGFWKHAAAAGGDRSDLLSHAPHQPLGAIVRQHDGRPHHAESVRLICCGPWAARRLGGTCVHGRIHGAGTASGVPPSLRVRHSDLHLPQRRAPHALSASL